MSVADMLLFPTAVRFDAAYHGAFQIHDVLWRDFPRRQAHMERMARLPGVAGTIMPEDHRRHYFDDGVFPVRRRGQDAHYIVPRTRDPFSSSHAIPVT